MAFFAHQEVSKLISRKIWMIEKSWNFHTVCVWFILTDLMPFTLEILTMEPLVLINSGVANIVNWYTDLMFTFMTRSYCSRDEFSMVPISRTPALLTKISNLPNSFMVFSTKVAVSDSLVRSAWIKSGAFWPSSTWTQESAVFFKLSRFLPVRDTLAPNLVNKIAVAAPMPELKLLKSPIWHLFSQKIYFWDYLAPVMSATLPLSFPNMILKRVRNSRSCL